MSEQFNLKPFCPICALAFGTEDTTYSTSCGHIFHLACLNIWKTKSTSCPQCHDYNPTMHRVFLNYELDREITEPTLTLYEQKKKISDLERDDEEKQILIQKLESDFDKFRKFSEYREQRLLELLTRQQLKHQKAQNLLNDVNKRFERKQKEAEQLLKESEVLKSDLESRDGEACDPILKTKNKVLEQRLKIVTAELEKQIAKNAELSIQQLKHQGNKD